MIYPLTLDNVQIEAKEREKKKSLSEIVKYSIVLDWVWFGNFENKQLWFMAMILYLFINITIENWHYKMNRKKWNWHYNESKETLIENN